MSLVIAVKQNDRIILGADKQSSTGGTKSHVSTKIWEVPELPGALMGSVGLARASQIIQYNQIIDRNFINKAPVDTEFVINILAPTLMSALKASGVKCDAGEADACSMMPNAFIFAYKDQAWVIWHDLSVIEVSDYFAIGSGADVARGALFATWDRDPFHRVVTSIRAAAESTLYVDEGIDLLSTDYRESDIPLIESALEPPDYHVCPKNDNHIESEKVCEEDPKKTKKDSEIPKKKKSKSSLKEAPKNGESN